MSARKNIFLESHNINNMFSGFGQFNYWLIRSLAAQNSPFEFSAYAKKKSMLADLEGVKFQKYNSLHRNKIFRIRSKYDIWHSMNQNSKIEPYHNIPYLLTIHDVIFAEMYSREEIGEKRFTLLQDKIDRSSAIAFISNHAKEATDKYFKIPEKVVQRVIYNGNPVKPQQPDPSVKLLEDIRQPFLFSLGQFSETKNFHVLAGMMSKLKDLQLVIAGNSDKPYADIVRTEIKEYNLEDRLFLVGKISEKEKHAYLQQCTAFVFPSMYEGFGLPPIEAMTYGKPVFLSRRTSLPEIGGEFAFYWDNFEPEHMAQVFEEGMKRFEASREEYERRLKKRAASFDWNKTAKEYLQLYSEILELNRTI